MPLPAPIFEAARERVYAMYPTVPDLWRGLHREPAAS